MQILKCKMCGGDLEITPGSSVATCAYCGSQQTAPNADNEKKNNLYNRANRLRFSNDFDKAAGVFESIVAEFSDEAEAYWGLCLCKYGIEYVDDLATGRKIPTCHRTSFGSIFDDSDYKNAIEYAYPEAQELYHLEATEIEKLQRAILSVVKKETPYDVFICYKETDENGQRTKDSVQAQDIYKALTAEGYKVFFARISLEDKLGEQYEPYIFSALNTAKVMLVVGTSYANMNSTWVKNEWSRYIKIMNKEDGRTLIPCYSDMNAYDMPEEFRNLQAQDMNKVGFIQDLVRGIGKIISSQPTKIKRTSKGEKPQKNKGLMIGIVAGIAILTSVGILIVNKPHKIEISNDVVSEEQKETISPEVEMAKELLFSGNPQNAKKAREQIYDYIARGTNVDECKSIIEEYALLEDTPAAIARDAFEKIGKSKYDEVLDKKNYDEFNASYQKMKKYLEEKDYDLASGTYDGLDEEILRNLKEHNYENSELIYKNLYESTEAYVSLRVEDWSNNGKGDTVWLDMFKHGNNTVDIVITYPNGQQEWKKENDFDFEKYTNKDSLYHAYYDYKMNEYGDSGMIYVEVRDREQNNIMSNYKFDLKDTRKEGWAAQ